jgi:hypothetical protein
MNHDDLRTLLDYPDQPAVPDVAAIIARGRRARTRRTVAMTSAVAAAVVAVVVAAVASVPSGPSSLASAPRMFEAPDRFDPLVHTLHVGWLPEGLDGSAYRSVEPTSQTYSAGDDSGVQNGPDVGLVVTVLARGVGVEEILNGAPGLPRFPETRPAEPVNGGRAECISEPTVPGGTCTALRWEYAPDAWAQVSYAGSAGPTPAAAAAVTRRVAESVSLVVGDPVRLPFTLSGGLAAREVRGTGVAIPGDLTADEDPWEVSLDLAPDAPTDPEARDVRVLVAWTPGGGTPGSDKYGEPNTVVDGHQARLDRDQWGNFLMVWGVNGTTVTIIDAPDPLAAYAELGLLDEPADPAGWVPVR